MPIARVQFFSTAMTLEISSACLETRKLEKAVAVSVDTEYDRTKVPPYNGNDPRPLLVV